MGGLVGKLGVLRIECSTCGRQGRYHIARLLAELGPAARQTGWMSTPPIVRKRTGPASLKEALVDEWPGILRWMINGAVDWYAQPVVRGLRWGRPGGRRTFMCLHKVLGVAVP
jgi:hypothetical protein